MPFASGEPTDDPRAVLVKQVRSLAVILREEFGVPFRFYEAGTGAPIDAPASEEKRSSDLLAPAPSLEGPMAIRLVADGGPRVQPLAGNRFQLVMPFPDADRPTTVAVGVLTALARTSGELIQEQARTGKWLRSVHARLCLASQSTGRHRHTSDPEADFRYGLEALMALEKLLRTQRIDQEPSPNREQLLQAAAEILHAQTMLWVPLNGGEASIVGAPLLSPWDGGQLVRSLGEDPQGEKVGYVINNRVQGSRWGARFPQVISLLAVTLVDKGNTSWVVALNKTGRHAWSSRQEAPTGHVPTPGSSRDPGTTPDPGGEAPAAHFRRTDAALLLPFAALMGVHLRAWRRRRESKGLMVGLARSLAAAVDSRDAFVAGHSERVARIAFELGRELGLRADELCDVYLGGLLHDLGKIGLRDSVLRKHDPLTPEEFAHVRQHVAIGDKFLADLRPIAHILPAVRHHHERYDGTGYPDGLRGEAIPLMARILAVAEGFDAMINAAPGRQDLPVERAEEILSGAPDEQWDGRVVAAYFRCRDRIHARLKGELTNPPVTSLHDLDRDPIEPAGISHDTPGPARLTIASA